MRHVTSSLAVLTILSFGAIVLWPSSGPIVPLLAQQPDGEEKAKPAKVTKRSADEAAEEESIEAKLARKMDFAFEGVPLSEVLSKLSEQAGVGFYIQAKALEDAGIDPSTPVAFKLRGVPLGQGLELMLWEFELVAVEQDELVMITTNESAESQLVIRVYDCRDLLTMPAVKFTDAAPAPLPGGPFPDGYGEGTGGYGGGASGVAKPPESTSRPDQLLGIITNAVDTGTWDEIGGPGTIGHYNGLIVITQTASTHKKVEKLLDMMRTAAGLEPSTGTKVVR